MANILSRTIGTEYYIPPPPRRAMGPDRNCRQLNCPVPIAHRGGGSAEVALEAAFSYNIHGRKTCHNEKRKSFNSSILVRLSYKKSDISPVR